MKKTADITPGHQALRKGRVSESGRIYHVITSTHDRYPYFTSFARGRCVVGEMHRLPEVIRLLKGRSAFALNRFLQRHGPVWQKSFYDHALRRDEDVRLMAQYIIANPLRRGLVEDVLDYPLWDMSWL